MPAASLQLNSFIAPTRVADAPATRSPGRFARLLVAFQDARMRQAELEVARFIEARGGRLTDDLERKIERHFV